MTKNELKNMSKEDRKLYKKARRRMEDVTPFDEALSILVGFFIFTSIPFVVIFTILGFKGPYSNVVAIIMLIYMLSECITIILFFIKEIFKTLRRK